MPPCAAAAHSPMRRGRGAAAHPAPSRFEPLASLSSYPTPTASARSAHPHTRLSRRLSAPIFSPALIAKGLEGAAAAQPLRASEPPATREPLRLCSYPTVGPPARSPPSTATSLTWKGRYPEWDRKMWAKTIVKAARDWRTLAVQHPGREPVKACADHLARRLVGTNAPRRGVFAPVLTDCDLVLPRRFHAVRVVARLRAVARVWAGDARAAGRS